MSQPINPYIAGPPLWDAQDFFGRQDTLKWVVGQLHKPTTNALLLFGQRRIGKTSFLFQLERALPTDRFLPVYLDLGNQATSPLGHMLAYLADRVTEVAGLEPVPSTAFDNEGRFFQHTFLPQLNKVLGAERRLLFLLDEFDLLDQEAEPFLPFLRRLISNNRWLAFVFIMGKGAEKLSQKFTALFKGASRRELWVLDQKSAERLIRQAESDGTLQFTNQAVARILSLTNCHPYLTQLLCEQIWEHAYQAKATTPGGSLSDLPLVDVSQVENVVVDALKNGEEALNWWWGGLNPIEKIYAAALGEIASLEVTIPEERVRQLLSPALRTQQVTSAANALVKRRVLDVVREQEYRFCIELFRAWVHTNKPLPDVKEEIGQVDPLADDIFKKGLELLRGREFESASWHFKDALGQNPYYLRARLQLGYTLLELGQIDEAITEFEVAYELDQKEAKLALIRGLLSQAKAREKEGDEEGALSACERVLEISPRERSAVALRAAIWTRRGDGALAKGELEVAQAAYQEAGDTTKLKQLLKARPPRVRTYRHFDLRLAPEGNQLLVEVLDAPAGEAIGHAPIPRGSPLSQKTLRALGTQLGQALMPGHVRLCFEASRGMLRQGQEGLRIRLRIHGQALMTIPWEIARIGQEYLSLATPLVRYVLAPQPPTPLAVDGPISILGIVSHPLDLPLLDIASEQTRLEQALEKLIDARQVQLTWLPRADAQLLQEALREEPHVIHYIGHGSYNKQQHDTLACRKKGLLWFTDGKGFSKGLSADWLATLLLDSSVRFVFLNACESGHAAGGLAEVLVRRGVPAVLGLQTAISDRLAIAFATGFYRALGDGWPVDAAVVEGRKAIVNAHNNNPNRPEWAQPVLYMRAPDGQLFEHR